MAIPFIAVFVRFVNTTYNVYEDVGIVELQLALSNPSSVAETVQVISNDVSTNGTYIYNCSIIMHNNENNM